MLKRVGYGLDKRASSYSDKDIIGNVPYHTEAAGIVGGTLHPRMWLRELWQFRGIQPVHHVLKVLLRTVLQIAFVFIEKVRLSCTAGPKGHQI